MQHANMQTSATHSGKKMETFGPFIQLPNPQSRALDSPMPAPTETAAPVRNS
eukprot:CAMPEP_0198446112 /NCGR_PEP_ID=MMETSP1453-20131121/1065_1 /TAXON_ID=1461543 ORGANISM="Unidentified sp., Strain RCC701" /NCGR_SAMPLE_ID=MMETSP1453 /ASSEMBLY_ACC=CAM_ASM_001118 /LENGTH=51 /DNA_ID=CAMNT_0044167073 /DNA_START=48 /DNA_END=200 /DNA_ORIENTATION=+